MKDKNLLTFILVLLSILLFFYVNNQVNVKIKYYEISKKERTIEMLRNYSKKLRLEYYTMGNYDQIEHLITNPPFNMVYVGKKKDIDFNE